MAHLVIRGFAFDVSQLAKVSYAAVSLVIVSIAAVFQDVTQCSFRGSAA